MPAHHDPSPPPAVPKRSDIRAARRRIAGHVDRTPLLYSPALSERCGTPLYLKMECWQRCGCFKVRGAVSAVAALSNEQRARGLVTCSSGNHGLALAYAAGIFGCAAPTVFVPDGAEEAKLRLIRRLGAEIVVGGRDFHETFDAAQEHAARSGATFVHSHDDPGVIAGQGTIGLEILEDLPNVAAVVVPVGGGGLISGIVTALGAGRAPQPREAREGGPGQRTAGAPGSRPRVIGVESAAAPGAWLSFRDGRCHERIELRPSIADGLSGTLSRRTFAASYGRVEAIHLVDDRQIVAALKVFLEEERLLLEPSAAVGLAAVLSGKLELGPGPSVLVLTGRNIEASRYLELVGGF